MSIPITGNTAVYLILGDPVAQVRAPEVFNLVFHHCGIDAVLVPARVPPQQLGNFIRTAFQAGNVQGMFLAIPHKAPAMEVLDESSVLAQAAGAVNGIRRDAQGRLVGGMFDGQGFVSALRYFGTEPRGRRALVLGAGGGASAIAASLAAEGAASVSLFDPVPGKAREVAARVAAHFPDCETRAVEANDPAGFDLVVNATPLGLRAEDGMPCDVARIDAGASVIDILMKNQPTPFVRAARARGLAAQPGFEMLIQQTPHYLDFFGHAEAANAVRADAGFIRELISS
ncbi:MAG: shikimate dehydrogenase [Burkholderiales bacterium]|nr:shikimate dehydrogenase [Burkholderiales bacterium]